MRFIGSLAFLTVSVGLLAFAHHGHAAPAIQSSPIVQSGDGILLLNVNQDNNSVTLFATTKKKVRNIVEISVGQEPVSVAMTSNRKRAFVANSGG